ncbi:ribulose-phosphate 3-epimerase [archaeon]|jgi:ribulose-phosphate 3-epimerase|nr:ribulose-phosphate 3-epimerase [archaeon]MBT4351405.1 ribulose-phosphate 3-epimerase [archaeon]MBT4647305.1 ribulose-phosphate 3-epimerase [archaeon]MBT6821132.1 ribulose-phosphate 3-epimerase [archaeon]MBT7391700.1 ribulose-phosphate 3-epimerase [archaeon]
MKIQIAPSILSADFGKLNAEIAEIEPYSELIHIDVMDGHFVPNITIGPAVTKSIVTSLPKDVHLMISDPVKYAPEFAKAGADMISFHAEIFENDLEGLKNAIQEIKKLNVKVGLTLNPDKPLDIILPVLDMSDFVLIMSVYAGFGGQKFMPEVLQKVRDLRTKYNYTKDIQIDGGISKETINEAVASGANMFVAGSAIFGKNDRKKAIEDIRNSIK